MRYNMHSENWDFQNQSSNEFRVHILKDMLKDTLKFWC